ncbi:hypothetical protein [Flavobacterium tyrosinilyticum]|uniref:hypothetical protein n=1 Tax=Flavobacterium tyrosinilyticum TaxID=1658740 RepID=UPI00202EBEEF|nr:hypothetical protein [Flavobacterium tyrosinilyticum]MCM0665606.1 hypothetical protein [Flavobacterium tyrosinilyticum]
MKKIIRTLISSFGNNDSTNFEKTFTYLEEVGKILPQSKICFDLLKKLNFQTTDSESDSLITALHKTQYPSNPTDHFYFFFPIVSHILYYKPLYEKEILKYLIGPNFANGTSEVEEMIDVINGAMKYKLNENQNYLSKESQDWITNELPKLKNEVQREIDICWKELED